MFTLVSYLLLCNDLFGHYVLFYRGEVEYTDSIQGFQLVHSLGGGSGSGLGSLIMMKIKEDFPDSILNNYSIIPSTKVNTYSYLLLYAF